MYSCGCGSQEEHHSLTLPLRPGNQGILFEKIPIHLPAKHNSSKIIIIHSPYEPCFLSPDTVIYEPSFFPIDLIMARALPSWAINQQGKKIEECNLQCVN